MSSGITLSSIALNVVFNYKAHISRREVLWVTNCNVSGHVRSGSLKRQRSFYWYFNNYKNRSKYKYAQDQGESRRILWKRKLKKVFEMYLVWRDVNFFNVTDASQCWCISRQILVNLPEKLHNKCMRSMFFAHSRDNATPYYNLLGILKFENVYKFKVALFTHKILNGSTNIPTIFHRTLTRASEKYTHNTRFASN